MALAYARALAVVTRAELDKNGYVPSGTSPGRTGPFGAVRPMS